MGPRGPTGAWRAGIACRDAQDPGCTEHTRTRDGGDGLCPGVTSRKAAEPTSTPDGCVTRPLESAGSVSRSYEVNRRVTSAPVPSCCVPAHTRRVRRYADGHGRGVPVAGRPAGGRGGESAAYRRLLATEDDEELARVLVERERPLWAREIAAFRLGCGGDRRAFEALVLLLNHRDPERCVSAPMPWCASATRARPGPPPPSRPTPCVPPTPCTRCGCSPPCGPRVRPDADQHPGTAAGTGRAALAGRTGLCGGAGTARRRAGPPGPAGGAAAPEARRRGRGGDQPASGGLSGRT